LRVEKSRRRREQSFILVTHDVADARGERRLQRLVLQKFHLLAAEVLLEDASVLFGTYAAVDTATDHVRNPFVVCLVVIIRLELS